MSKEKLLVINSKDRIDGTNGAFTVVFNDSSCQQVVKVLVKDIWIPNLFYNITSSNNVLSLKQDIQATVFATVPQGQYSIDQLITVLKTKIDAVLIDGCVVTITKNPYIYTLNFTFSGSGTPSNNNVVLFDDSSISDVLGLKSTNVATNTINMEMPYNLKGVEYVQVHSPQVAEAHGLDAGVAGYISLLESVSLAETGYGSIAHRQNNDDELALLLYEQPRNLSRVNIVLRDESGKRLDLPDNAYATVVLKIFFD